MKKVIFALVLLLVTAPSFAAVNITCSYSGNEVTVRYDASAEAPNNVRAFALDITLDNGVIYEASKPISGIPIYQNDDYDIYPGSIDINDTTGEIDDYGTTVADPCDAPSDTKGGYGTSGVTIEAGSLYAPTGAGSPNAPASSGVILQFWVCDDCNVSIAENTIRGGVVMEDPDYNPTVNLSGVSIDMHKFGTCATCYGDYDGNTWVRTNDLAMMVNDLGKYYPTYRIYNTDPNYVPCMDMNMNGWERTVDVALLVNQLGQYYPTYRFMDVCP